MKFSSVVLGAALVAQQAVAHPGQSHAEHVKEVQQRELYLSTHKRSLAHCADKLKARGNDVAMHERRDAMVKSLRQARSIDQEKKFLRARDADEVLATSHHSNLTGITPETDPATLFSGNNSCVLTPETTEGPYWVSGELIRQDVTEGQKGVPMTLDIQVIDVNTCEPVPQSHVEIWSCNATGVYSGVNANNNGNSSDLSNIDETHMRGVQESEDLGVVTFDTLVPGHYVGRTNHIHVMSHLNATVNANNTISGGAITHVGQIFFDQDLLSLVEATEPYASNTQELTTNAEDDIFEGESEGYDPVVEYVLLGDDVSEGIFAWISFGMDSTASYNETAAAYWTANGGVENENAMGGGPGGAPPSGAMPSGMPGGNGTAPFSGNGTSPSGPSANSTSYNGTTVEGSAPSSSFQLSTFVSLAFAMVLGIFM